MCAHPIFDTFLRTCLALGQFKPVPYAILVEVMLMEYNGHHHWLCHVSCKNVLVLEIQNYLNGLKIISSAVDGAIWRIWTTSSGMPGSSSTLLICQFFFY